jgi:antitoxin MazE
MKSKIIQIGNSRGIRIPKALLEQAGLTDEVNIDVVDAGLFIRSTSPPRAGWDLTLERMAGYGNDTTPDDDQAIAAIDALFKRAAKLTGVSEKASLVRMGLDALIGLESSRRLAALGGKDKGARVAPRRKSNKSKRST